MNRCWTEGAGGEVVFQRPGRTPVARLYFRAETIPVSAMAAAARWDAHEYLWSMGMSGTGREDQIQAAAFILILHLHRMAVPPPWTDARGMARHRHALLSRAEAALGDAQRVGRGPTIAELDAACNLAYVTVRFGWRTALLQPTVIHRLIYTIKGAGAIASADPPTPTFDERPLVIRE